MLFRLKDKKAVRFLLKPNYWKLLNAFIDTERSVKEAATLTGSSLPAMYEFVKRALKVKLIKVTRVRPRKGRATKYYQAVAERFFIAFDDLPGSDLEEHILELEQSTRPFIRKALAKEIQARIEQTTEAMLWGRMYGLDSTNQFRLLGVASEDGKLADKHWWHPKSLPPMLLGRGRVRMSRRNAEAFRDAFLAMFQEYEDSGEEAYWIEVNFVRAS